MLLNVVTALAVKILAVSDRSLFSNTVGVKELMLKNGIYVET
jgi:hypothetical protein